MKVLLMGAVLGCFLAASNANDFAKLDEALPTDVDALSIAPVFDFDSDGCFSSSGISRAGQQNGGLQTAGSLGGGCRESNFLDLSNTMHRHKCIEQNGNTYCGHVYALYFEKDQVASFWGLGHRHDWEHVVVYTTNGVVTHGGVSCHGDVEQKSIDQLFTENGHLKVVYHKDGATTHCVRFAKETEFAENPYQAFVTPTIASWFELTGDGLTNEDMRGRLSSFNYGSAIFPIKDSRFFGELNKARPELYPSF